MASIYFPLRTNVHYWDLDQLELGIESRLKLSTILYDDLILEDGGYVALVGPKGHFSVPVRDLDAVPDEFFESHGPPEGGEFMVVVDAAGHQVEITSPAQRRYQICLREEIRGTGLLDMPWIRFSDLSFTEEANDQIRQLAQQDTNALHHGQQETYSLHLHTATSVNHDWIMALINGWDVNMDPSHEGFLRQKLSLLAEHMDSVNPPVDFELAFPRLPDLAQVPWDEILTTRHHPVVIELRKHLSALTGEARQAYLQGEGTDLEAVRHQITKWRDDQLISELGECLPTPRQTARQIVVNLVLVIGGFTPLAPLVAMVDTGRGVLEPLVKHTRAHQSTAAAFVRRHDRNNL